MRLLTTNSLHTPETQQAMRRFCIGTLEEPWENMVPPPPHKGLLTRRGSSLSMSSTSTSSTKQSSSTNPSTASTSSQTSNASSSSYLASQTHRQRSQGPFPDLLEALPLLPSVPLLSLLPLLLSFFPPKPSPQSSDRSATRPRPSKARFRQL